MTATMAPADAQARVAALVSGGGRRLLGIAGAPGSGKSSLAAALAALWPEQAVVVPMDGFHLANVVLEALGRAGRKGAPDTFDVDGFLSLLARVRAETDRTVYAPAFRRDIEEPIAGAIAVPSAARLIIIEGNYLYCDGPWQGVRGLLDERWFVQTPQETRLAWLQARHEQFGRSPDEARAWIEHTDEPNAALIATTACHAEWTVYNAP